MKVYFDYPDGPVLGHRVRCEILEIELIARGHQVERHSCIDGVALGDVYVTDHPAGIDPPVIWPRGTVRIMVGREWGSCWTWNPLGEPGRHVLTGLQYIILDPWLKRTVPTTSAILITMGGSDQDHRTEMMMDALRDESCTVVQGPNFGREITTQNSKHMVVRNVERRGMLKLLHQHECVVCGWGQTTFEAIYCGARVLPVSDDPQHHEEAERFKMLSGVYGWMNVQHTMDAWSKLRRQKQGAFYPPMDKGVFDLNGAARTADWIEMLHRVYGRGSNEQPDF